MKNFGKKLSYIDSNFFIEKSDLEEQSSANDPVRNLSGFLWTKQNNKFIISNTESETFLNILEIKDDEIVLQANKQNFTNTIVNDRGLLENEYNKNAWKLFIEENILPAYEKNFEDYYFEVPEVIEVKNGKESQAPGVNYSKKEFIYNFYSQKYENLVSESVFNIRTAPSIISIASDPSIGSRSVDENINLAFGGLIDANYVDGFSFAKKVDESVKSYFNKFVEVYNKEETASLKEIINSTFTNIKIDQNKLNYLRAVSFVPFPFFTDFSFTNIINSSEDFSSAVSNIGKIKKDLIDYIIKGPTSSRNFIFEENFENIKFNQFDLKKFISDGIKGLAANTSTLGNKLEARTNATYTAVEYANLIELIKKTLKNKKRSYKDMLNKPCSTEVLFYKVEKREFNFDKSPIIQNFYIEPDNKENIRIIDTQIKYGTKYFYTIKAYILAIGNQYSYQPYDYSKNELLYKKDLEEAKFRIKYKNNATYKIFEIPYGKFSGAVFEKPFTKPQLKINQHDDSINFSLSDSETESLEEFEFISSNDFLLLEKIKDSQENENENFIHSVRNYENNVLLEIYKSTEKPINYLSFQGKLYKKLYLKSNTSFKDSLIPNLKHYYTFRYINTHGIPSNLSKIYEIELRDEDGYRYLILEEINVNETAKKVLNKNLKRYLLIRPSMLQTFINVPEHAKGIKDIYLGPDKQSVWKKDFIIRITSKKTNRVLEFDLKSILKYDE